MATGEWTGTMNLTEPQCGTDLGLSKAMATPQKDGSFKLTGTKIFITGGEQDLSENIIHLVLAKTPGAPKGIKGISLFNELAKRIPNYDFTIIGETGIKISDYLELSKNIIVKGIFALFFFILSGKIMLRYI